MTTRPPRPTPADQIRENQDAVWARLDAMDLRLAALHKEFDALYAALYAVIGPGYYERPGPSTQDFVSKSAIETVRSVLGEWGPTRGQ